MAAPSSSAPSSSSPLTYDVFLSFRGQDTRKTFVDHLYSALDRRGMYAFKDDRRLRRGELISPEISKAIADSTIAVVIFSVNYADSSWCLDELRRIVECRKTAGMTVFPVFYDVDPSEVRKRTGKFGEGFAKHSGEKVKEWRNALWEVANLSGWDLKNTIQGHEAQCIKEIVGAIWNNLRLLTSSINENLVGIESRVLAVKALLGTGSADVCFIGLWGMGGIGKTTIAKAVFEEIACQFEGRSYVKNVRKSSEKSGLQALQQFVLSDVLMETEIKVGSVDDGKTMIRKRLCLKKVLIVLDNVDHITQLRALAGEKSWFGKGSVVIATTRDEHLLVAHKFNKIHNVNLLTDEESLQLFCNYAFKTNHPQKGYEELSRNITAYAARLPLALKVLGSFLFGRGLTEWKSALYRLQDIPDGEILDKLKISFDGLKDVEQEIFLDIACFFKGWKAQVVVRMLDSFGFYPDIGIQVLLQKSLITLSNGRFYMHDLIQEMGHHIVRPKHPNDPGKHTRLWKCEEVLNVLMENAGSEEVRAIVLEDLHKPAELNFDSSFTPMKKLRLLYIRTCKRDFKGTIKLENLPNELRWLTWDGYGGCCLPDGFRPKNLVGIEMRQSGIRQLWNGIKFFEKLKYLNLSESIELSKTPDITGLPNLEKLMLECCTKLVEVHPSIGVHEKLSFLNLRGCCSLCIFPSPIQMKSLEILILSGCLRFNRFPVIRGNMDRLLELHLANTDLEELPSSIGKLVNLVLMNLTRCKNLRSLPSTIYRLVSLKTLHLSGCSKLEALPKDLAYVQTLEELVLDETGLTQLPLVIVFLKNLRILSLHACKGLSLNVREELTLRVSVSSSNPSLPGLSMLKKLNLSDCGLLGVPKDIGLLSSLEELTLCGNKFTHLPLSVYQLSRLKVLELSDCLSLEELPLLPSSLEVLYADCCMSLRSVNALRAKLKWLWKASFVDCLKLSENQLGGDGLEVLLQSMLEGYAIGNHRFSILLPGQEIPRGLWSRITGDAILIKLPPNWHNEVIGCALYVVFDYMFPKSNIKVKVKFLSTANGDSNAPSVTHGLWKATFLEDAASHLWLGYLSFNYLLDHTGALSDILTSTELFLTFQQHGLSGLAKLCGGRLVYKEGMGMTSFVKGHQWENCVFGGESTFDSSADFYREQGEEIELSHHFATQSMSHVYAFGEETVFELAI